MLYSIDRLEGDLAVLIDEDENTVTLPRTQLPADVKAGDMLRLTDGEYTIDAEAARARRERILRLQQKLRHKD